MKIMKFTLVTILFFMSFVMGFISANIKENAEKYEIIEEDKELTWHDYNIIVHALGDIHGTLRSHSIEAFVENYLRGGRVFEVDLSFTMDGTLVAIHPEMMSGNIVNSKEFTLDEFVNSPFYKEKALTPLTFEDIIDLMINYQDIYIITDTKETDFEQVQRQFNYIYEMVLSKDIEVMNRIIPQLYNEDMFDYIEEIYPFEEYIFTMYLVNPMTTEEELLYFLESNSKVNTLTIAHNSPRLIEEFISSLNEINIKVYVHTLNNIDRIEFFWQLGVWGFYSDLINEEYLLQHRLLRHIES